MAFDSKSHHTLPGDRPAAICQRYKPADAVTPFLAGDPSLLRFMDRLLVEPDRAHEAIDFFAHAFPRQAAVWWGCLVVQSLLGDRLSRRQLAALRSATRWVLEPNEERRRAAHAPAEAAGLDDPAGLLAMAAYVSETSCRPPHLPPSEPPDTMSVGFVAGAVHLAVSRLEPPEVPAGYRRAAALAIGIARGKHLWAAVVRPA